MAIYLCVVQLFWTFLRELIVLCQFILWSNFTYVLQPHIFKHFITSSMYFAIILIPTVLPIDLGYFKPLLGLIGCQLANLCLLVCSQNSAIFNSVLQSAGNAAIIYFGHFSISMKHKSITRMFKLRFMELWKSLRTPNLALSQLVSSAASCHNLITEYDSLVNYWPTQFILIFNLTWNCLQLRSNTSNLVIRNFPNFSLVKKPNWIIFDYINNWLINNSSNILLYLVSCQNHRERPVQNLFVHNYAPIGPTRSEISWARFSRLFPIGDIPKKLFKFLQILSCLWFLPAKWSVSQPLVSPVVGSSQPLCRKLSIFWHFSDFCSFFVDFLLNYRAFTVILLIPHVYGEDPLVLSSLSPNLPTNSEDFWFISPIVCLFLLSSVVHCLTLTPLVIGWIWTQSLWIFFLVARHVSRLGNMCLNICQHIGGSILATTHYPKSYLFWKKSV